MKRRLFALAGSLLAAWGAVGQPVLAREDVGLFPVIISLQQSGDPEVDAQLRDVAAGLIAEAADVEIDERLEYEYTAAINGLWMWLTLEEVDKVQSTPIDGVQNVTVAPEVQAPEPMAGIDGYSYDGPQTEPTGWRRIGAQHGKYSNVDVAVIDTGVDAANDDLDVVGGFDCTDAENGELRWGVDGYGHGTHVAGTIAAIDNDRLVVGVAAGARIWSFKVLGEDGSGSYASVLCGVDQVAQRAAQIEVANLSLGGGNQPSDCGGFDPMHNGFCHATDLGVIFVVSAGNDAVDLYESSPANYPEVVTVSALADYDGLPGGLAVPDDSCYPCGPDDTLAVFSNYGSGVDFIAPGVSILSTLPGNQLGRYSGTSMASPHVTGTIAAWIADNPNFREYAVQAVMEWSINSWGRLDSWDGDHGPDHEPLVLFGAPEPSAEQLMRWKGDL